MLSLKINLKSLNLQLPQSILEILKDPGLCLRSSSLQLRSPDETCPLSTYTNIFIFSMKFVKSLVWLLLLDMIVKVLVGICKLNFCYFFPFPYS